MLSAGEFFEGLAYPKRDITISAAVDGQVTEFLFEEGSFVEKGQWLVQYDSKREELTVAQAELQKNKYEKDYESAKALAKKKIFTNDKVFELEHLFEKSKIELEVAQFLLSKKKVLSPISGVLIEKNIDVGERAQEGKAICRVVDTSSLILEFYISVNYLNKIKEGDLYKVKFPELSQDEFEAKLMYASPQIDAKSGLFKVKLEFDNQEAVAKAGAKVLVQFD